MVSEPSCGHRLQRRGAYMLPCDLYIREIWSVFSPSIFSQNTDRKKSNWDIFSLLKHLFWRKKKTEYQNQHISKSVKLKGAATIFWRSCISFINYLGRWKSFVLAQICAWSEYFLVMHVKMTFSRSRGHQYLFGALKPTTKTSNGYLHRKEGIYPQFWQNID